MIKLTGITCLCLISAAIFAQGPFITVSSAGRDNTHGLFVYRFQHEQLQLVEKSDLIKSTSYHNFHPEKPLLYAVGNNKVYALSIDERTGHLSLLNEQDSKGNGPCYVSVDETGKYLLVANYSGATVAVFPIDDSGRLGEAVDHATHQGSSIDTTRQKEAHPHLITAAPGNKYVLVPDLGTDQIVIYDFNARDGQLEKKDFGKALPGSGPRHLEFHPSLPYVFVLNELNSTVSSFHWDGPRGTMQQIATYPLLPDSFHEFNKSADIHLTGNGQFLYASNRGHNSLTAFKVNDDGTLVLIDRFPSGGDFPRNFFITPDDQFLLVANQNSHNILQYRINAQDGYLEKIREYTGIPGALCIKMR
jgi:6-phosphogluconolactonase